MNVLVQGSPVDGLRLIGPFERASAAVIYADEVFGNDDCWWAVDLERPVDLPFTVPGLTAIDLTSEVGRQIIYWAQAEDVHEVSQLLEALAHSSVPETVRLIGANLQNVD